MDVDFELEAAAGDVFAEEAFFMGFGDGFFDDLRGFGELFTNIDVSEVSVGLSQY